MDANTRFISADSYFPLTKRTPKRRQPHSKGATVGNLDRALRSARSGSFRLDGSDHLHTLNNFAYAPNKQNEVVVSDMIKPGAV